MILPDVTRKYICNEREVLLIEILFGTRECLILRSFDSDGATFIFDTESYLEIDVSPLRQFILNFFRYRCYHD